jgi:hypothetical protein
MMFVRIAAGALLMVTATSISAQSTADTSEEAAKPEETPEEPDNEPIVVEAEREKKVCDTVRETGSILPRRVCRTEKEVAENNENARLLKERLMNDQATARHTAEARSNAN